ncbi:transposase [Chloroflexota bacterium]
MKELAEQHDDWLLFEEDECWFSRFAQPNTFGWAEKGEPVRFTQRTPSPKEPDKALACFGAVRQDNQQTYLYFADGQPNSENLWLFIIALLALARHEAKKVVVMLWDNASWHKSQRIRQWIRAYNQQAKRMGEPRLWTWLLPLQSPWLNPIEPRWFHAKRAVCEPDGDLPAVELKRRLSVHFDMEPFWNSQTI